MWNMPMKQGKKNAEDQKKRAPYEAPAIIYEGLITTRGGDSLPGGGGGSPGNLADPSNLFGNG